MFQPQEIQISVCLESMLNVRFCVLLKNGGSRALFTGLARMEFRKKKKPLKLGLTALFTNLEIISQRCFQFSVISGIQTYLN